MARRPHHYRVGGRAARRAWTCGLGARRGGGAPPPSNECPPS